MRGRNGYVMVVRNTAAGGRLGILMTDTTITDAAPKRGIFIGSKGLRAGWGVALFVAVVVAAVFALRFGLQAIHFHGPKSDPKVMEPIGTLFQVSLQAGILLFATLVVVLIDRRPWPR